MDPPYQGVSAGRDRRYAQPLELPGFLDALAQLNTRGIRYLVSFDGRTGARAHGEALPAALGLRQESIHAERSAQSTLSGRDEPPGESLYLSPSDPSPKPETPLR